MISHIHSTRKRGTKPKFSNLAVHSMYIIKLRRSHDLLFPSCDMLTFAMRHIQCNTCIAHRMPLSGRFKHKPVRSRGSLHGLYLKFRDKRTLMYKKSLNSTTSPYGHWHVIGNLSSNMLWMACKVRHCNSLDNTGSGNANYKANAAIVISIMRIHVIKLLKAHMHAEWAITIISPVLECQCKMHQGSKFHGCKKLVYGKVLSFAAQLSATG